MITEKPLDNLVSDGGFCGIFRTIGCVGDSLASGEFESMKDDGEKGYHDCYEYSWGQYIARACGNTVYNFSMGGMNARMFVNSFGGKIGFYDKSKVCQAYIIALGVNDMKSVENEAEDSTFGTIDDINFEDSTKNADTFVGNYARIVQDIKQMQPKARIFLMTMPRKENEYPIADKHREFLHELSNLFEYVYVLDFRKYAPIYDAEFRRKYYLGGHMNAMGYMLTAKYVMSYIDYIIRNNMEDFSQIGFVGTPFYNCSEKW